MTPADAATLLLDAGVTLIQVRDKTPSSGARLRAARSCLELANSRRARVVINDRCDVALLAEAHGVHLGEEDLPAVDARSFLGEAALVGTSTHAVTTAVAAMRDPVVSYVALGPIFETKTKASPFAPLGLDAVREVARRKTKPLVVIGGITSDRVGDCLSAGADSIAMVAGLLDGDVRSNVERSRESAAGAGFTGWSGPYAGRIYLVGFMGCGKTTIGRALAERLGVPFLDLDEAFEAMAGRTIRETFETRGEAFFRAREAELLIGTADLPSAVVALGGGTFVAQENAAFVRSHGVSVFLDVPFDVLAGRLSSKGDRPLFRSVEDARELHAARYPWYKMANRTVSLSGNESVEAVVRRIESALTGVSPSESGER